MPKQILPVIGKIGSFDVTDYKGHPILNLDGSGFGIRKIKVILANTDACKAFLAKYDVAKAGASEVDPVKAIELAAENKRLALELEQLRAGLKPADATPAQPATQSLAV